MDSDRIMVRLNMILHIMNNNTIYCTFVTKIIILKKIYDFIWQNASILNTFTITKQLFDNKLLYVRALTSLMYAVLL